MDACPEQENSRRLSRRKKLTSTHLWNFITCGDLSRMLIMYNLIWKNKHSCHYLRRLCRLKKTRSFQSMILFQCHKWFLPATYSPWDEWERISPQSWETEGTKTQQEKSLPGPGCCCCQLRPGPSHKHPVIDLPWAAAPSTIARKLWATFARTHIDSKYTPIS